MYRSMPWLSDDFGAANTDAILQDILSSFERV